MSLTKKTGIYVIAVVLVIFALLYWKQKIRILIPAVSSVVISMVLIPSLLFPVLNVSPGSKVEILGFFYQQTARYVSDYPDDVALEERNVIDGLMGIDTLADRYNPHNVDDIKGWGFDENIEYWPSTSELLSYAKVYLAQGIRHPDAYLNAVLSLCSGWFYLDSSNAVFDRLDYSHLQLEPDDGSLHIERNDIFQKMSTYASSALVWLNSVPFFNLLLSQTTWTTLLPILIGAFIARENRLSWQVILPLLITFLFLMLCPVSSSEHPETFRYALPLIMTTPLLLGVYLIPDFGENSYRLVLKMKGSAHGR